VAVTTYTTGELLLF